MGEGPLLLPTGGARRPGALPLLSPGLAFLSGVPWRVDLVAMAGRG